MSPGGLAAETLVERSHRASSAAQSREQLDALRRGLAWCRRDELGIVEVQGEGTRAFLQRLVSADLRSVAPGAAVPAALLTPKAQVVALLRLLVCSDARIVGLLAREQVPTVAALLDRYSIGHEVSVSTPSCEVVGVYGPRRAEWLALGPAAGLEPYRHVAMEGAGGLALGDDELGTAGVLLLGPDVAAWLAAPPTNAGIEALSLDAAAIELARLEAGAPRMGVDVDETTMLLEAGQLGAVSFDKGCYPGQEPVCRVHSRGQVNWRLLPLRLAGSRVPAAGEGLAHPALSEAGRITSAAFSPALDQVVALGYVHRRALETPGPLALAGGGLVEVVTLPRAPDLLVPRTAPRYAA